MKDTIREVVEEVKKNLPLEMTIKLNGATVVVDILEIDEINVKYIYEGELDLLKFKDFRSDLMRYNRYLVDYIIKKLDNDKDV